jgi:hypothetical protein
MRFAFGDEMEICLGELECRQAIQRNDAANRQRKGRKVAMLGFYLAMPPTQSASSSDKN